MEAQPRSQADVGIGRLTLPAGWSVLDQVRRGGRFVLLAAGPAAGGFAPNVVAVEEAMEPAVTLRQWHLDSLAGTGEVLASYRLIDVRGTRMAGYPAIARLGAYGLDRRPLTVVQWVWLIDDAVPGRQLGLALTATCHTRDYPALDPQFGGVARSYRVVR
ncbi:MAG: hypothetical protein LBM66_02805 [Bifidobacteriaceae bacterium]|jgi:hypothetical protein|nr:hypothetical protein [Bifidobacteriaceae bacterium]